LLINCLLIANWFLFAYASGAEAELTTFEPEKYSDLDEAGRTIAERGIIPITHMRYFQQNGALSDELVKDMTSRNPL
jgi:hypothetical protein